MDEAKLFEGRHWAATEKFYARLATATERLEAKKTPEKGYAPSLLLLLLLRL